MSAICIKFTIALQLLSNVDIRNLALDNKILLTKLNTKLGIYQMLNTKQIEIEAVEFYESAKNNTYLANKKKDLSPSNIYSFQ